VPADYEAARSALKLAAATPGPVYVRMGRAALPAVYAPGVELEVGHAYVLREGTDVTVVAMGVEIREALLAADELAREGVSVEVIDAFSVKPLDVDTIAASAAKTGAVVACEEHSVIGGLGSAVAQALSVRHPVPMEYVGMEDRFGKSGSFEELMNFFNLDSAAIVDAVKRAMAKKQVC
jgi:transketolase